jgi:hypothetical protein
VIDVSVGCALGAWTVAVSTVLGYGRRLPVRERLGVLSLPVLAFRLRYQGGVTSNDRF